MENPSDILPRMWSVMKGGLFSGVHYTRFVMNRRRGLLLRDTWVWTPLPRETKGYVFLKKGSLLSGVNRYDF